MAASIRVAKLMRFDPKLYQAVLEWRRFQPDQEMSINEAINVLLERALKADGINPANVRRRLHPVRKLSAAVREHEPA